VAVTDWAQVAFNSAVTGSLYALVAIGLTLTYGSSKFPNFAHAEFMLLGGYVGYTIVEQLGLGFPLGFIIAFIAAGFLSVAAYRLVFRPLIRRGATLIHLMVASIGLGFIIRQSIQQVWGGSQLSFRIAWASYDIGPIRVTNLWLSIILVALLTALSLHLILTRTKLGKAVRATSNNPELAMASGINTERISLFVWFVGAAMAGLGGLFKAADSVLVPMLGFEMLLPAFATAILGGIGSFYGAITAAYILGMAENFGVVALVGLGLSTGYRSAVAFIVIILVLIIRPSGLGKLFKG